MTEQIREGSHSGQDRQPEGGIAGGSISHG